MNLNQTCTLLITLLISLTIFTSCGDIEKKYRQGMHASDAQAAIGAIYNATKMQNQDLGKTPKSIHELIENKYLVMEEKLLKEWKFSLVGSNPITQIKAVSTSEMVEGTGHTIVYDIQTGRFSGWGIPESK